MISFLDGPNFNKDTLFTIIGRIKNDVSIKPIIKKKIQMDKKSKK